MKIYINIYISLFFAFDMRQYPKSTNKEYSHEDCLKITRAHRASVLDIMNIFCRKLKNLWKTHDKDKEEPENLIKYTYLLNHPEDREIKDHRKNVHNHNNTHHIEWFLACDKPKLQKLVEMICDQVAAAIERDAQYEDIFEEHKKWYMQKWLPENLAIICTNTFIDLWNSAHENK